MLTQAVDFFLVRFVFFPDFFFLPFETRCQGTYFLRVADFVIAALGQHGCRIAAAVPGSDICCRFKKDPEPGNAQDNEDKQHERNFGATHHRPPEAWLKGTSLMKTQMEVSS